MYRTMNMYQQRARSVSFERLLLFAKLQDTSFTSLPFGLGLEGKVRTLG
jgi:hypothetical protein